MLQIHFKGSTEEYFLAHQSSVLISQLFNQFRLVSVANFEANQLFVSVISFVYTDSIKILWFSWFFWEYE